jgi:hypothetical protein
MKRKTVVKAIMAIVLLIIGMALLITGGEYMENLVVSIIGGGLLVAAGLMATWAAFDNTEPPI